MTNVAYGIDFGTSNSTICVSRGDKTETLHIESYGKDTSILRSLLYFHPQNGSVLFGQQAIEAYLSDIALSKSSEKKTIFTGNYIKIDKPTTPNGWAGTHIVPEMIEIDAGDAGRLVQSLKSGLGSKYIDKLYIFDKVYSIQEVVSLLLSEIKKRADRLVGESVTKAVIGRPVHFVGGNDDLAISRLAEAAHMAGFTDVHFEYEPIGAAWEYGAQEHAEPKRCFVFDFGGGTLDFSIVEFPSKKVITNGGMPIGGDLLNSHVFEKTLFPYFGGIAHFGPQRMALPSAVQRNLKQWYLISLMKTRDFLAQIQDLRQSCDAPQTMDNLYALVDHNLGFYLYEEIDRVKKSLSTELQAQFRFHEKGINIEEVISRMVFEYIISEDLSLIDEKIDQVLAEADLNAQDIDVVITTGGSSLIPVVQKRLKDKFPDSSIQNQNAFTSVANGLAIRAQEQFS